MAVGPIVFEVFGVSLDPEWKILLQERLHCFLLHLLVIPKTIHTHKHTKKTPTFSAIVKSMHLLFSFCNIIDNNYQTSTDKRKIKEVKGGE
jgi:hypothetical protein